MPRTKHFTEASRSIAELSACFASIAVGLWAFEWAYARTRFQNAVPADVILYYNAILDWARRGHTPFGFTLVPAPSFVDMIAQVPIAVATRDFEQYGYGIALAYAVSVALGLFAISRRIFGLSRAASSSLTVAAMFAYHAMFPYAFCVHAFMQNHTSEVAMSLLGVGLFAPATLDPSPSRQRRWLLAHGAFVTVNVLSSGYFVATYVAPFGAAIVAFVGTRVLGWRRAASVLLVMMAAVVVGLCGQAFIATYQWPIRLDSYPSTPAESWAVLVDVLRPYARSLFFWIVPGALVGSLALAARYRWKLGLPSFEAPIATDISRAPPPLHERPAVAFLAVFVVISTLTAVGLPLLRGAYHTRYELRYLVLPEILSTYLVVLASSVAAWTLLKRWPSTTAWWHARLERRPFALSLAALLTVLSIIIGGFALRGPWSPDSPESVTSKTLSCFDSVEKEARLGDGLATVVLARYMNAARLRRNASSHGVVVQILQWDPPTLNSPENNLAWFRGDAYRRKINFIGTDRLSPAHLAYFTDRVGKPDRIFSCPMPPEFVEAGKDTFDIWVFDDETAQQRLGEFVMRDPMRAVFAPPWRDRSLVFDPIWGMTARPGDSELRDGHFVWRLGEHPTSATVVRSKLVHLPSGRYRLSTKVDARGEAGKVVGELVIVQRSRGEIGRAPIYPGKPQSTFDLEFFNKGGAVSGEFLELLVVAHEVTSVDVSELKVEQIEPPRVDVLRLFR